MYSSNGFGVFYTPTRIQRERRAHFSAFFRYTTSNFIQCMTKKSVMYDLKFWLVCEFKNDMWSIHTCTCTWVEISKDKWTKALPCSWRNVQRVRFFPIFTRVEQLWRSWYTSIVVNILCQIRCIVERRQLQSSDFHFSEANRRALMLCMWLKRQNLYSCSQFEYQNKYQRHSTEVLTSICCLVGPILDYILTIGFS